MVLIGVFPLESLFKLRDANTERQSRKHVKSAVRDTKRTQFDELPHTLHIRAPAAEPSARTLSLRATKARLPRRCDPNRLIFVNARDAT
jgi:hypothetical protein